MFVLNLTLYKICILIYNSKYKLEMKYVAGDASSQTGGGNTSQIDWNDFNYPPCLKIYHYNSEKVALFRINHTLIIAATFLNFITNIIDAAEGVQNGGIRIGISIFLFLFWIPLSFLLFFLPYHIIMKNQSGKSIFFYILSAIAAIFFFIWCIADFADANGFVMAIKNFSDDRGAAGTFGIITAVMMLAIAILSVINAILFFRR